MASYFSLFPTTTYSNTACVDLTRRVVLRRSVTADPRAMSPYEVPSGQRADHVADGYYGSPDRDWLVYLSAGVVDPYFDWYQPPEVLVEHLVAKYGSLVEATERVHHWRVDWLGRDEELDPSGWASLPVQLKRYYEPRFGRGTEVVAYSRREEDTRTTTNMVVEVEVTGDPPVRGERVTVLDGQSREGQAEVASVRGDRVSMVHVQSGLDPGLEVVGATSGARSVVASREYVANVVPVDERPYWSPVSVLQWETELNESTRSVRLVDSSYVVELEVEARRLLGS